MVYRNLSLNYYIYNANLSYENINRGSIASGLNPIISECYGIKFHIIIHSERNIDVPS